MKFSIDAGPGTWAAAQGQGNGASDAVSRSLEVVRLADRIGIDSVFALEDPDGWDAFGFLNAAARETEHIRLGTGITNPYYRHPSLMAASLSTLDLMSNGRAFLGLGRGQSEWYADGMGMPWGKPVSKLTETIDLLRQWFREPYEATSPETATEFGLNAWKRVIHPVQTHMPFYLAAVGPKAQLIAARHTDGLIFNDLTSRTFMRDSIETIRSELVATGRDANAFHFYARAAVTVTSNPEELYERRKDTIAIIHALPGMEPLLRTAGFDIDRIIGEVRRHMRTNDILARGGGFPDLRDGGDLDAARKEIPTDLMRELIVAGTPAEIRTRLREFEEIGITHVFLSAMQPQETAESLAATIEAIAP